MHDRNIIVTLHKASRSYEQVGNPRHYARIETALRKIGERIPHIFVVSHAVTGLEIGTVTVGGFNAKMIWDRV